MNIIFCMLSNRDELTDDTENIIDSDISLHSESDLQQDSDVEYDSDDSTTYK